MGKLKEQILLFQFRDEERLRAIRRVLSDLHIPSRVLTADSWPQKIGHLLDAKGFPPAAVPPGESFDFPHEVMLFSQIKGKRLDMVLCALRDAGLESVRYKAVVTPFNTLWTLRHLCETMQKEHAYLAERAGGAALPPEESSESVGEGGENV